MSRLAPDLIEEFWSHIDKGTPDVCWPWTGPTDTDGYGRVSLCKNADRIFLQAHRVAWAIANGTIPHGHAVLHACASRLCCNPRHLRKGPRAGLVKNGPKLRGVSHPRATYTAEDRADALAAYRGGSTRLAIAGATGIHRVTISRWIEEVELESGGRLRPSKTYLRARPAG